MRRFNKPTIATVALVLGLIIGLAGCLFVERDPIGWHAARVDAAKVEKV